jgi:HK97 family phage portal protein
MWPFRQKAEPFAISRKSGSFLVGMRGATFTAWKYRAYAAEGYAANAVVHTCVSKIATAGASVDICVYRKRGGKIKKLDKHPLIDLLARPNPMQSGRQFMNALLSYRGIGGEYFILGNGAERGQTKELQLLDPDKIVVKPGQLMFPACFEYKPSVLQATRYAVDQITGKSAVLHGKTFNPLDAWRGLSPMAAAAYGVDIVNEGQRWNKKLIDNECRPPGALVVEEKDGQPATLGEEQYLRLKEQIDNQLSGAGNAGRPLLLEGGLKWQQMGMNPRDMDFKENIWAAARFVASVYGVPSQIAGIPGESTYSNYEQAELSFWANTVLPTLGAVLDDLNRWLTPQFGDDLYLWYDEEMIPALEPLRKAKGERINQAEYLTIDEKRNAMGYENYKPSDSPGGVLLVSSSDIPIDMAGDVDLAEPGSEADKPDEDEDEPSAE